MKFWDKITGNDMTVEFKKYEARVKKLPPDYIEAWEKIKTNLWPHSDFTGRNLMAALEGVLSMLEEASFDGRNAQEVLGDDIEGFCSELIGLDASNSFRNTWRKQLNENVSKKLGK
jgi:DNA-binding ferritin-like protein (Dps family)